jgi:hypothetical protein
VGLLLLRYTGKTNADEFYWWNSMAFPYTRMNKKICVRGTIWFFHVKSGKLPRETPFLFHVEVFGYSHVAWRQVLLVMVGCTGLNTASAFSLMEFIGNLHAF